MAVILDLDAFPDTFTAGNWPLSTFNDGDYTFTITPTLASSDSAWGSGNFFAVLAANDLGGMWIYDDSGTRKLAIFENASGSPLIIEQALTWNASQTITITVKNTTNELIISGAATGNGTFSFTGSTTADAFSNVTLGCGVYGGGGFTWSGAMSDISDVVSGYTIDAESGSCAITGTNVLLHIKRVADPGAWSIAGTDAALVYSKYTLSAESGSVPIEGKQTSFFNGSVIPQRRSATAPVAGLSTTSPSDTEVGDMVLCWTWERTGAGSPTHTLQANFREIRTHAHDDGSTDGRLSCAYKICSVAGAQSYQPYTSSDGTATWTGCVVIKRGTFGEFSAIASNSVTGTTNAVPDPNSVTLSASRNYLVFAVAAWHHGSSASITPGAPTNYTDLIEVAGSANGELAITSRKISSGATSEDPGAFTDNVAPNGTCSMTVAIPNVTQYIACSPAEFFITPTDVTLSKGVSSPTISAEAGSLTISGTNASLLKGYLMGADPGTLAITGTDAATNRGFGVVGETTALALTGTDANLLIGRKVTAESGAVALNGTDAALTGGLEVGDHGMYQVNFGHAPASGSIDLQTSVTGSSFLLLMGGNMNDIGDGPTDSESNTWRQISTSWQYADAENSPWGVAAWRVINGTGDATQHTFTQGITVFDEMTMFAIELRGVHYLVAHDRQEEANAGTPGTVGPQCSITIPSQVGSCILLASWWGSGPVGQDHTASPDGSNWVQLEFYGTNHNDGYVQGGVWGKIVSPGTHTVQFTHSPAQGSKAWLMAFAPMPVLSAESGSVPITGTDVSLKYNRRMTMEPGTLDLTGIEVTLVKGTVMVADPTSVDIVGTNAALLKGYLTGAESGVVDLTGTNVTLTYGHPIVADQGVIALVGTDADLRADRLIAAEVGAVALAGTDSSLERGSEVAADTTNVPVAGVDAGLLAARKVTAEPGGAAITGTDTSLKFNRVVISESGSVALTGTDAGLNPGFKVTAEAGSVLIVGVDTSLIVSRYLLMETGAVAITGTDAELDYDQQTGYEIDAETGAVAITGTDAGLAATRVLTGETTSIDVTGTNAALRTTRYVLAQAGGVDIIAPGAELVVSRRITAEAASVALTGTDASLRHGFHMPADAASVVLAGVAASLLLGRRVDAEAGSVGINAPAQANLFWSGVPVPAVAWAYTVRATIDDLAAQGGFVGSLDDLTSVNDQDSVLEDLGPQVLGTLEDN